VHEYVTLKDTGKPRSVLAQESDGCEEKENSDNAVCGHAAVLKREPGELVTDPFGVGCLQSDELSRVLFVFRAAAAEAACNSVR